MSDKERKLPETILNKQKLQREESMKKVQKAINEIKSEGYKVTMKLIQERSNLARSTLSKPHIQDILRANCVCKYEDKKTITNTKTKNVKELEAEIYILEKKIERLKLENSNLKNRNNALKVELYDEKDRNAKLLGELQLISDKCRQHNIRLELIKEAD